MKEQARESLRALRRRWLNLGCDGAKLAQERKVTKQAVSNALKRINALEPLTYGHCDPLDQAALNRAARILLESRDVQWRIPLERAPDEPTPAHNG